ncbi:hypothetical protein NSQ93_22355 [Bacillus sp. FSL W8-0445]|uniref:hypothetical protein n=1 Tax=Bacillota TaxID=1239 RepID=UPI0011BDE39D|nr:MULTISPECIES: hypothetical protein [Bacillota]NFT30613.1 hypothetical protein [Clostridium sporogenes]TWM14765.1 hypothetical protein CHCC15091_1806 [Bacillus licheniformis]GIN25498.1 hypothetical protein J31TS2_20780 [Bacillus licheniformis]GIN29763.1 hypothetical protein J2TS5_18020 [Bacillus licheniformis]
MKENKKGNTEINKRDRHLNDEIYEMLQLFIENDKKATGYFEIGKIGTESMIKIKRENIESTERLIRELIKIHA